MNKGALISKIIITAVIGCIFPVVSFLLIALCSLGGIWDVTMWMSVLILPLAIPFLWLKKKKAYFISYISFAACTTILFTAQKGIDFYNDAITIDVTPNIQVEEYLPFEENSKIVKIDSQLLDFEGLSKEQLPRIDGATAAFPVYSAFVHAVYPESTKLDDGVFNYYNTVGGYYHLAERTTDVFIGAYPSKEQIAFAKEQGTEFVYTQIGSEAFVFFVHKDNPIEDLTTEQIKGIYSGEITNWSEVGGNNEPIVPFQRPEGSGSQSMLIRIMGDATIVEPDTKSLVDGMGGIIQEVADYKNKSTSIGFSFRYYVEGIIQNPDIKMIAIDGVYPSKENIKNGAYPFIASVYAVTYAGNPNENVQKLVDWILSEEGQYIIEETGYVGVGEYEN